MATFTPVWALVSMSLVGKGVKESIDPLGKWAYVGTFQSANRTAILNRTLAPIVWATPYSLPAKAVKETIDPIGKWAGRCTFQSVNAIKLPYNSTPGYWAYPHYLALTAVKVSKNPLGKWSKPNPLKSMAVSCFPFRFWGAVSGGTSGPSQTTFWS